LVEFAFVLPVFLLILSGVLDFGFLLYSRMTAINAIKESAQCGATGPCTVDASGNPTTWSLMTAAAGKRATDDGLSVTPSIKCLVPPVVPTSPWPACNPAGGTLMSALQGDAVQATATYSYQTFFPLLFGAKINVTVSNQIVIFLPPPPN
jgi:Flp pilus assembly protein TadG